MTFFKVCGLQASHSFSYILLFYFSVFSSKQCDSILKTNWTFYLSSCKQTKAFSFCSKFHVIASIDEPSQHSHNFSLNLRPSQPNLGNLHNDFITVPNLPVFLFKTLFWQHGRALKNRKIGREIWQVSIIFKEYVCVLRSIGSHRSLGCESEELMLFDRILGTVILWKQAL